LRDVAEGLRGQAQTNSLLPHHLKHLRGGVAAAAVDNMVIAVCRDLFNLVLQQQQQQQ
jgi:hypothetical protein